MTWKYSANLGFFGARLNKFYQFRPQRTLAEKFELAAAAGVQGVEVKFPGDGDDADELKGLLERHRLALSAVNVDTKDVNHFRYGALSAADPAARAEAVRRLRAGMDLAASLGCGLVTTCPLSDGYDYPFQIDYADAWGRFIDSVKAAVSHRDDVTLLLEYQPREPHAKILLSNVGAMLHVAAQVDAPNLGANFDVGHSFAAGEAPAEAAALLASRGLLRYIHTNDNTGDGGDWDMVSGSVHFWHWVELVHTLSRLGYDGWLGADIEPKTDGPAELYRTNILMIRRMDALVDRLGFQRLADMIRTDGNTAEIYALLTSVLDGG
ncbi:MAG: sugar phosphate isomerase/epimerase [Planctomycetes bacterium]|nr:sugar phosphate isomerase/epimerase [Planctomycetota bacterium]